MVEELRPLQELLYGSRVPQPCSWRAVTIAPVGQRKVDGSVLEHRAKFEATAERGHVVRDGPDPRVRFMLDVRDAALGDVQLLRQVGPGEVELLA
jgi:hypothetical protein